MSSNAPWSVKGIDPKAREAAKDLARRSGLTLGEWLNQRIAEESDTLDLQEGPAAVSNALEALTDRLEAAEQRSTLAVTGVDQTVRGMLARLETTEREQVAVGARFEGALQETSKVQALLEERLRKLEQDAAGPRSAEALKSLEGALGRVANHLYDGESRTRESLADMRRDMNHLAAKLESVEKANAGEDVASRLIERLDQAQARMDASVRALQRSMADIQERLAATEAQVGKGGPATADIERRLDEMAVGLAQGLQAARDEMTRQIREATDAGADRLNESLMQMSAHVQAAERRSADALERMGQEVLRVAETLNRRVQGVETRAAGAISKVGTEVARVVDALESRADRTEATHAQALDKLGGEIARVTERLSDRIGTAERRSAQAVDDVAEKVGRLSDRLNQRYEHSTSDIAERIRASEERTARLLEEARERIERRLAEASPRRAEPVAAPAPSPTVQPEVTPEPEADPFATPIYSAPLAEAMPAPPTIYPDAAPFGQTFAPEDFVSVEPDFDQADLEAAQDFSTPLEPESEADFVAPALEAEPAAPDLDLTEATAFAGPPIIDETVEPLLEPRSFAEAEPIHVEAVAEPARPMSTRELIEQARAAARAAAAERDPKRKKAALEEDLGLGESALSNISFGARKKRPGNKVAMAATFGGATLMLGAAGYLLATGDLLKTPADGKADGDATGPRAAVALNPRPIDTGPTTAATTAPTAPVAISDPEKAKALYKAWREQIDANPKSGLAEVQKQANLGNQYAQYYLGRLYEDGDGGLAKDLVEARRWYERAATAGEPGAMHNVALMYFEGVGGPKNTTVAAQWFRQAAELGLADSQFNLGQLYEQGLGVSQNSAEAYKWYLLASKSGPETNRRQAREAAARVRVLLPTDARATAERIAADIAFKVGGSQIQVAQDPNVNVAGVQKALNQLGYYRGPTNGAANTELRVAIQSYQRDQGISPTGVVDNSTLLRLSPYMR